MFQQIIILWTMYVPITYFNIPIIHNIFFLRRNIEAQQEEVVLAVGAEEEEEVEVEEMEDEEEGEGEFIKNKNKAYK